jgi:hypothetical protein
MSKIPHGEKRPPTRFSRAITLGKIARGIQDECELRAPLPS